METLRELHERYHIECICPLKKTATQPVFGDGNPKAKIVFIGEAPGKKEDLEGKPFIGAAGKFLTEMLASINLKREDVYITNTVKYRPPDNRDPLPEEKLQCQKWLFAELNHINPSLIIFLGRHAMNTFFPEKKISDEHGKLTVQKITGLKPNHFFALYHPAAALYNGSMRATLLADFVKIPTILKKAKATRK